MPQQNNGSTAANRSRSMILQPEDVVPLTADEAIADIEKAVRAVANENGGYAQPPASRG